MKEYIASLEKEFSLVENGFKEEEKRALTYSEKITIVKRRYHGNFIYANV